MFFKTRNMSALSFLSSQPTCDTNRPLRRRECKQPSQERLSYKSVKPCATIPTGCMGNGYFLLFDRSSQSKPEGRRIHEHACSCYLSIALRQELRPSSGKLLLPIKPFGIIAYAFKLL